MAINITYGGDYKNIITLVYGKSGVGKTSLIPSLAAPFILDAEDGLLAIDYAGLGRQEINQENIKTVLPEVVAFLKSEEAKSTYKTIAIDSISEIAELLFKEYSKSTKDNRLAYTAVKDFLKDFLKSLKNIKHYNIFLISQIREQPDELGEIFYSPFSLSQAVSLTVSSISDIIMALRIQKDGSHFLMCQPDNRWLAKDRRSKLDAIEPADMELIFKKIGVNYDR